ncbi:hypothetical protein NCS57_01390000 [Fusarium keratoplasticum]|uniref:Uncharacterized protein n=1 Tax=Fusarium keratoplasticum TaxID=1328300 RepID=A0ACC0QCD4_9HYPO|nr:hypothetical protein NCS57_01390000 [Fusarium keratoplasticum]KAI8650559.1 hypothetical protein NCS57_01390000 [Fusarium keratoplasticum]
MTGQSPRSPSLIERINIETEKCLTVLNKLPRPAQRNARALHAVEAKLAAAETEEECQAFRAERRRLIRERESGLKEATRDWHDETNDVVEDLVTTLLKPILREIESHIAKSSRDTAQIDTPSGVDQVAISRTPTMPATPVPETNQAQGPSVDSTILAADQPTNKRKASPSRPPAPKRQRRGLEKNTITFAEVFRNGKAPIKRIIVQYPPDYGQWYIIRCRRHNINFKENPLKAASRHICQSKHPNMPRNYVSVIKMMGYRVVNCDEDLAEQNNAVAREAFGIRSQPPSADSIEVGYDTIAPAPERPLRDDDGDYEEEGGGEFTPQTSSSARRRSIMAITDPTAGEVYQVYWRMLKKWTAAIVLPLENLERFGVKDSIESLGLLKSLPSCYTYDSLAKTFQWSEGYEAGGKYISKREFPVMFFNGAPFPNMSEVAWVPAKDLNPPEICALEPVVQRQVLDFLAAKEAGQEGVVEDESEERSVEEESEDRGVEEGPERANSREEENPCQTIQQNGALQPSAQTVPMDEEATETSQPARNVESSVTAPIVIDLTGEDSEEDEESAPDKDTPSGEERPANSAIDEAITDEELVAAEDLSQAEPENRNPSMDTAPSTNTIITDPPTPVVAQSLVADQESILGLQPTPSMTPEATLVAQLACRMVDQGDKSIELQHMPRRADAELALQHSHPERPQETLHITQSSPNVHRDERLYPMTPVIQDRPRQTHSVHPIPRPQTVGPSPGRLPELRVQTNHQEKSACRLPSIQNLLEGPKMGSLGNSQLGTALQSPMMTPSPYTPGSSIPNHLRPDETPAHPTWVMTSPQLTPQATSFRSWNWLSCFTQPIAEQLQLASGSPAPASPRDFMDHMGRLQCPFCRIHVLQLDHFTQHLQHPC